MPNYSLLYGQFNKIMVAKNEFPLIYSTFYINFLPALPTDSVILFHLLKPQEW